MHPSQTSIYTFSALLAATLLVPRAAAQSEAPEATPGATQIGGNCSLPSAGALSCKVGLWTFSRPASASASGERDVDFVSVNVFGPGVNLGPAGDAGWSTNHLQNYTLTTSMRGISQGEYTTLNCHKAGDCIGKYLYVTTDGGVLAPSDESTGAYMANVGESPNYFHGSIPASLGVGFRNVDPVPLSGSPWTTDQGFLINTTRDVLTRSTVGPSRPLAGTELPYLHNLLMLNALPVSGSDLPLTVTWATAISLSGKPLIANPGVPANASAPFTLPVHIQPVGGAYTAFPEQGIACVAGDEFVEQSAFTARSMDPATHSQILTLKLRNPNPSLVVFFGGVCGRYFNFDADFRSTGMRQLYPALGSLTGADLIYAAGYYGTTLGRTLPVHGSSLATDRGPNPIHLFHGAEIVANRSNGANPTLEANTMDLEAGDLVEGPHPATVGFKAEALNLDVSTPCNADADCELHLDTVGGSGINSTFRMVRARNSQPSAFYTAGGGHWGAPVYSSIEGPWSRIFEIAEAPQGTRPGDTGTLIHVRDPAGVTPKSPGSNADWNILAVDASAVGRGNRIVMHPGTGAIEIPQFQADTITVKHLNSAEGYNGEVALPGHTLVIRNGLIVDVLPK